MLKNSNILNYIKRRMGLSEICWLQYEDLHGSNISDQARFIIDLMFRSFFFSGSPMLGVLLSQ